MGDKSAQGPGARRLWGLGLITALLIAGAVLRLSVPSEIEYKADEAEAFQITQVAGLSQPWPSVGVISGAAIRNPPLSIWIVIALARVTGAHDPVALSRAVATCNLLALALVFFIALRIVPAGEREPWLWAGALACVSPIAVIFSRKIWAQSTLPLFCSLYCVAWFRRRDRAGAFFWGLLGAMLGQIHMSGFFFAAAVAAWTAFLSPNELKLPKKSWRYWLAGSCLGALPLIPWIAWLAHPHPGQPQANWIELVHPRYWAHVFDDALGLQMNYSLGSTEHWQWMRYPLWSGHASFVVAACSLFLLLAGLRALALSVRAVSASRPGWAAFLSGGGSESRLLRNSALLGAGILLSLSALYVHRHYLIVAFPLEWLWFAQISLGSSPSPERARRWLAAVVVAELVLSACFLLYIHQNHGALTGDFGRAYRFQLPR